MKLVAVLFVVLFSFLDVTLLNALNDADSVCAENSQASSISYADLEKRVAVLEQKLQSTSDQVVEAKESKRIKKHETDVHGNPLWTEFQNSVLLRYHKNLTDLNREEVLARMVLPLDVSARIDRDAEDLGINYPSLKFAILTINTAAGKIFIEVDFPGIYPYGKIVLPVHLFKEENTENIRVVKVIDLTMFQGYSWNTGDTASQRKMAKMSGRPRASFAIAYLLDNNKEVYVEVFDFALYLQNRKMFGAKSNETEAAVENLIKLNPDQNIFGFVNSTVKLGLGNVALDGEGSPLLDIYFHRTANTKPIFIAIQNIPESVHPVLNIFAADERFVSARLNITTDHHIKIRVQDDRLFIISGAERNHIEAFNLMKIKQDHSFLSSTTKRQCIGESGEEIIDVMSINHPKQTWIFFALTSKAKLVLFNGRTRVDTKGVQTTKCEIMWKVQLQLNQPGRDQEVSLPFGLTTFGNRLHVWSEANELSLDISGSFWNKEPRFVSGWSIKPYEQLNLTSAKISHMFLVLESTTAVQVYEFFKVDEAEDEGTWSFLGFDIRSAKFGLVLFAAVAVLSSKMMGSRSKADRGGSLSPNARAMRPLSAAGTNRVRNRGNFGHPALDRYFPQTSKNQIEGEVFRSTSPIIPSSTS